MRYEMQGDARDGLSALSRGRKGSSATGLSLVEIMASAAILVIILMASSRFLYHGRSGLDEEERKRTAMEFTSNILENVRSLDWEATHTVDTTRTIDQVSFHTVVTVQEDVPYQYASRTVARTTWSTKSGDTRTITFATFVPLHP
jgi:Tfp pilus assembly protein PilV